MIINLQNNSNTGLRQDTYFVRIAPTFTWAGHCTDSQVGRALHRLSHGQVIAPAGHYKHSLHRRSRHCTDSHGDILTLILTTHCTDSQMGRGHCSYSHGIASNLTWVASCTTYSLSESHLGSILYNRQSV